MEGVGVRRSGRRKRGVTAQAKGSADVHGNPPIHSALIISINAERLRPRRGGGGTRGVGEFWEAGSVGWGRMKGVA